MQKTRRKDTLKLFIKGKIRQCAKSFNKVANLPTKRGKEDLIR